MPVKRKSTVFDKNYNLEPGMNDTRRVEDSKTWKVDVEMLTSGKFIDLGDMSGPQVGPSYDADALGEDREMITFPRGDGQKRRKTKEV